MSFRHPWPPAYTGVTRLPTSDVTRITVEIPKSDADTIISVALSSAILTAVSQYAIKQTAEMIRTKRLTHADQRAFFFHLCQRTYSEFVEKTGEYADRGGDAGVCDGTPVAPVPAASVGEKVTEGSGGGRGKGRGKGKKA